MDHVLRKQARRLNKSLNDVTLEAPRRGVGSEVPEAVFDDLNDCIGTWQEDADFDAALKRQHAVDRKLRC